MKVFFWLLLVSILVVSTTTTHAQEKVVYDTEDDPKNDHEPQQQQSNNEEQREHQLRQWRIAMQEVTMSVSAGPLSENFTPEYMAKRKATSSLNNQISRARGQLVSTMIETVGVKAETCFGRRFSDDAISMLKREFEQHGFKVDWTPDSNRDIKDKRRCYEGRESIVVMVEPASPDNLENKD